MVIVLKASGRLASYEERLIKVAETVLDSVKKLVPLSDVDVVFEDNPDNAIGEEGSGGYAVGPHIIRVYLNPEAKAFNEKLEYWVSRTLSHELSHTARFQSGYGFAKNLLEAVVFEGLAEHFMMEVNGGEKNEFDDALTVEQLKKYTELAQVEYLKEPYDHFKWFFGTDTIPYWTGYTLGFNLVEDYLKRHPEKKASELYNFPAEEFLK